MVTSTLTPAQRGDKRRESDNQRQTEERQSARDIYPIDCTTIDWQRRRECSTSLKTFGLTYLPSVFNLGLSADHHVCIDKMESVFLGGGQFALAMPRGQGKTSWSLAAILWGLANGHRRYAMFIGAMDTQAAQLLDACKANWYNSNLLLEDYPELAFPIRKLENRHHLASGQLHRRESTSIEWGAKQIRFGSIVLDDAEAAPFLQHMPEALVEVKGRGWMPLSAGAVINTAGIGGSMRGSFRTHPVTLEQMRPDVVIMDDVQKDQGAESPTVCDKLERVIDGAIKGMGGPDKQIAAIMPCTVIRIDDVSDRYLSQERKPEWRGERCKMVTSWPEGMDDHGMNTEEPAAALWMKYKELREQSFRQHEDDRDAVTFYIENKAEMIEGFEVSWDERFYPGEEDAIVHAMNLRFENADTFASEFQNNPKPMGTDDTTMIGARQLAERLNGQERAIVPGFADHVVAHIDVQDEILFWMIYAGGDDYTGSIIDYGCWPEVPNLRYWTKAQAAKWMYMSRAFLREHPNSMSQGEHRNDGKVRAQFEGKIYSSLKHCCDMLLGREYQRVDGTAMRIQKLGIDIKWGKAIDTCRRFVVEYGRGEVIATMGQYIGPDAKQYYEYNMTKGWRFEHQVHRGMQECRWVWRRDPNGFYYMSIDTNAMKTFLHNRLSCHRGSHGAVNLFTAPPEQHEMVCDHICNSEYPEPMSARGRTKDIWKTRDRRPDNDYLDTAVGCMALSSWCGARIKDDASGELSGKKPPPRKKLSEIWAEKRGSRG